MFTWNNSLIYQVVKIMTEIASTRFHNSLKLTEHEQTSVEVSGGAMG